ncbi:MAG: GNAT family N-acetyltransferase [Dehalococcoidales bacterium]|nr:GNAT family N-acetyltransferase [Dehalococcoidales bacterium]
MNTSSFHLETKNLLLVSISMEYKEDIFREFTLEIATYMYPQPYEKIEDTIRFIQHSMKRNREGNNLQLVVLDRKDRSFLGCAGIHNIDTNTPEFGIWLKKSAHGNSYGKEAIFALNKWADENLNYEYLLYPVTEENSASKRIPELLGGIASREYDDTNMSGVLQHVIEYRIYPDKK